MAGSPEFPVYLGTGLIIGLILIGMRRNASLSERIEILVVPVLLAALVPAYLETLALNTQWTWSACRLAPTFGLAHGYPLYSPAGVGPINGWLYGPVAALLWWPATLADSPLPALQIAAAINLFFLLVPLLAASGSLPRPSVSGLLAFSFGAAVLLQIYPTWYMASALNVDAVAVGLGAGSCLLVLHAGPGATGKLWLAAGLAGLAIWTKQTEVSLLPAQVGWLWLARQRAAALRYAGMAVVTLLASAALAGLFFPPEDVLFNLWSVPAAHALPGGWNAALTEAAAFVRYTVLLWLPCLLVLLARKGFEPAAPGAVPGLAKGIMLFGGIAALALPLGIVAAIKVGGDRNSVHSVYYLLVAATFALGQARPVVLTRATRMLPGAILLAAAVLTGLAVRQVAGYAAQAGLPKRCLSQEAWTHAQANPGRVYFPWDPLATLMAEGRMYHFEYGVIDRIYAGHPPRPGRMREDLPANARFVIYPRADYSRVMLRDYFPEFGFITATEDWLIYGRPNDGRGLPTKAAP